VNYKGDGAAAAGAAMAVWQAVCNKIRRHSDVDVRPSDVDVSERSDVDVKAQTTT